MTLTDCLLSLGRLWADAHGLSLSRLGQLVAKDGKFFVRIEGGRSYTVATWERFLTFFREPANWPEGVLPADAADMLDQVQTIAVGSDPFIGGDQRLTAQVADDAASDRPAPGEAVLSVHAADDTAAERNGSATKTGEIIREGAGADSHRPFSAAGTSEQSEAPAAICATCSTTPAPAPRSAANLACSAGEGAPA